MNFKKVFAMLVVAVGAIALSSTAFAGAHGNQKVSKLEELPARTGDWTPEEIARGRKQLIRAFDAAWIRFIDSRGDQAVLDTEPVSMPGAAHDYIYRLVDCLPHPKIAPWPEKPVGMFKDILDTGVIRKLVQGVPSNNQNTSWYFSGVSQKYLDAVLKLVGDHYGVELKVENIVLAPGRLPATSVLVENKADFISQLNATGGDTQGLRRRESRRFTCTMTASSQFIHIPEKSPLAKEINSLNDLIARPEVGICAGPLTTQTAQAYMPEHTVKTKYVNDLTACDKDIQKGKLDVIMNPLPDLSIAGIEGYRSVPTLMVAGTPLWVADEGITCDNDGDPKTEDECHEDNPY